MKKTFILGILSIVFSLTFEAKTVKITNVGNLFSPDSIAINLGDTVNFSLSTYHNAVQVSKENYDKNDSTSNSGFRLPYGGGKFIPTQGGTYYYVCSPHVKMGMKGIIVVNAATTSVKAINNNSKLSLYPNPSGDYVNIAVNVKSSGASKIKLYSLTGAIVKEFNVALTKGDNTVRLQFNNELKAGKYFLELNADEQRFTHVLFIK